MFADDLYDCEKNQHDGTKRSKVGKDLLHSRVQDNHGGYVVADGKGVVCGDMMNITYPDEHQKDILDYIDDKSPAQPEQVYKKQKSFNEPLYEGFTPRLAEQIALSL